jgi:addiction module RelE/StbE family toxin
VTKLIWSPQSLRDLESIRDYVATDSPRYAALVVERIIQGVERLTDFPESGRVVPERNDSQLREVIVRPYRVVYRIRTGVVEIATVFRASRIFPELK